MKEDDLGGGNQSVEKFLAFFPNIPKHIWLYSIVRQTEHGVYQKKK